MECIDRGFDFCLEDDRSLGYCCENEDTCWTEINNGLQCTFDIKYTKAEALGYWLCPFDPDVCG